MCPDFPRIPSKEEFKRLLLELLRKDEDVRKAVQEIIPIKIEKGKVYAKIEES